MNSFISWIGGKKLLRNKIIEMFPQKVDYNRYVEVFGGAGWVLFAGERHAELEVYNDINGNLVNLFYHTTTVNLLENCMQIIMSLKSPDHII